MRILVQKFGGTSVATPEHREHVLRHICHGLSQGYSVVVVLSAMGRKGEPYATDTLLEVGDSRYLASREQDLLLSCGEIISAAVLSSLLNKNEISNTVLTGAQAGIITSSEYNNAHIITIKTEKLLQKLNEKQVVIVTGFQGCDKDGEITTLGRGGSDTTATALGSALKAEFVDIFTDVHGVMTADPKLVSQAAPLEQITYNEICNLAFQGAKVMHPHSVEIAMQGEVPIRIRATKAGLDEVGTIVTGNTGSNINNYSKITGIAHMPDLTQLRIIFDFGNTNTYLQVFEAMAMHSISVDFISVTPGEIVYTVLDRLAPKAIDILSKMGLEPNLTPNCAKISIVGAGITGVPGIMAKTIESLVSEDIQVLQSADSYTTIWVLVHGEDMHKAVQALHTKFGLDKIKQGV